MSGLAQRERAGSGYLAPGGGDAAAEQAMKRQRTADDQMLRKARERGARRVMVGRGAV
jgi:hypothetical protein